MTEQHLQIDQKITKEEAQELPKLLQVWGNQRDRIRGVLKVYPQETALSQAFEAICAEAEKSELDLMFGKITWADFNRKRIESYDQLATAKTMLLFNEQ